MYTARGMRPFRLCWLALLAALLGCSGGDAGQNLLSVQNFGPRHVDVGDRVELVGAGFPEGKTATVTFRGELRRPGATPRDVRIVATAAASSPDKVSITLDPKLQSEFCGRGDAAQHTTFHGDVTVAFAPRRAGAPPVTGVLHDVLLDVEAPAPSHRIALERDAETRRALGFLGLSLAPEPSSDRLRIDAIRRASPAERAGLLASDTLLSVDGVSVYAPADAVPARSKRFSRIVVRRGRLAQPLEHRVDVAGFHSAAPIELIPAAIALGIPTLLLLVLRSRLGLALRFLSRLLGLRLRARRASSERWRPRAILEQQVSLPEARALPYLVFLTVSAAFTVIAFGQHLVGPDLDLGLACVAATTALLSLTLVGGGLSGGARFSLTAGFASAWATLAHQLPVILAVLSSVLARGSFGLRDAVSAQGGWPWQWRAFESPAALVALTLALIALVPSAPRTGPRWHQNALAVAEWGQLLVLCGVVACLFLGGWNVPLWGALEASRPWGRAAGAALLQLKYWGLVSAVLFLRWLVPGVDTRSTARWCWRWAVPVSVVSFGLTLLWSQWPQTETVRELEREIPWVLLGTVLALSGLFVLRIRSGLRRRPDAGASRPAQALAAVNPWL